MDFIRKEIAERSRNIRMKIGIVIKIFSPGGGEEKDLFSSKASRFVTLHHGDTVFLRKNLNVYFSFFFFLSLQYTLHTVSLCILLQRTDSNEKEYAVAKAYIRIR